MTDTNGQIQNGDMRNPFNYDKFEQISRDLTTTWFTLDEIAQQLNLGTDESQDDYLSSLDLAVRMQIEDYLGMPIFSVSYRSYYGLNQNFASPVMLDLPQVNYVDSFNSGGITINNVKYYNSDDPVTLTTISSSNYFYDKSGNKLILNSGVPNDVNTTVTSPILIEYTVKANVLQAYPNIKQAGLLLFTHLYNNRSETTLSKLQNIPYGVDCLLRPYTPLMM